MPPRPPAEPTAGPAARRRRAGARAPPLTAALAALALIAGVGIGVAADQALRRRPGAAHARRRGPVPRTPAAGRAEAVLDARLRGPGAARLDAAGRRRRPRRLLREPLARARAVPRAARHHLPHAAPRATPQSVAERARGAIASQRTYSELAFGAIDLNGDEAWRWAYGVGGQARLELVPEPVRHEHRGLRRHEAERAAALVADAARGHGVGAAHLRLSARFARAATVRVRRMRVTPPARRRGPAVLLVPRLPRRAVSAPCAAMVDQARRHDMHWAPVPVFLLEHPQHGPCSSTPATPPTRRRTRKRTLGPHLAGSSRTASYDVDVLLERAGVKPPTSAWS